MKSSERGERGLVKGGKERENEPKPGAEKGKRGEFRKI